MPEVEEIARKNSAATVGSYKKVSTMEEAFQDADIVYPKSRAPFAAMEQHIKLHQAGDQAGPECPTQKLDLHRGDDEARKGRQSSVSALSPR